MILAIDVGNTSISFGIFKGKKLIRRHRCLTHPFKPSALKALAKYKGRVKESIVCSVVPKVNRPLETALRTTLKAKVVLLGRDRQVPIPNTTRYPKQVGMDRLVNAWAAWQRFKRPCVVVDFGTATTFDVVNAKGEYIGGIIAPGVELTLNALAEKTALLPRIELAPVKKVVGYDTLSSIRSGCSWGLAAMCDGLLDQLERESRSKHKILATGGYARFIAAYGKRIRAIDQDLTLKAISEI